ncbi:MAG: NAD(P)/FAD-dependent oxidoreductase [Acidobacteria bacterium]|nr:NAD(P)/FAD-dependent oxidoreductase [Acidobacteriota bacterium]MCB9377322.1 NAD(P)/FAD-dependent oxidoreductase [Holophagales bacterium]
MLPPSRRRPGGRLDSQRDGTVLRQTHRPPRVVVLGGGFGGVAVTRALRRAAVDVTLVDRRNHHLFQPLLYQVATAGLAPGDIAASIRQIFRRQKNVTVAMAEILGVDVDARRVRLAAPGRGELELDYDLLVVATGVAQSYFGHDEFAPYAPALKTIEDATAMRSAVLGAFERAEIAARPGDRSERQTFVLVGAGPTGVEMAGALAELSRATLAEDFRRIDPKRSRIVLLEAGPRVLPTFHEALAGKVHGRLEKMGVEVRCGRPVELVDARGVVVGGERIEAGVVLWTAGVKPSPAAAWLGVATDRAGRVLVGDDLSVPGRPEVFVVGDVAGRQQDGAPLPGVAQVAIQGGHYVGRAIAARATGRTAPPAFRYRDKGNLAVVGRNYAVFERGGLRLSGFPAWLIWAFVHIQFLALFNNKLLVFAQWIWSYFTFQRGSRLITGSARDPSDED